MKLRSRSPGIPFVVLCLWVPVSAQERELTPREIQEAFSSPDSHHRHKIWTRLNPEDNRHYKVLLDILRKLSWHDRDGAIIALAKAATEETLGKLVKELKSSKDPFVRQGIAQALAKMNDEKFYPHLYEALGDANPYVRRVVVHSLRVHKRPEAVDALVDLFEKEDDPVIRTFIEQSLNELTQAYQGPNPVAWRLWWMAAKADKDYELGKTDEDAIRNAEALGNKLKERKTVSMAGGVTVTSSEKGLASGAPILILPFYGYSKRILMPFLSELEKTNKLFYIDLPPVSSFKDLKVGSAKQIPYYPIDQLVKAFEDLRKETGQERFALMACGMNAWIAMRYATLYPNSVSQMVLVAPISSGKAYGDATTRFQNMGKARNDIEMWHLGLTRLVDNASGENIHDKYHRENNLPKPEGEDGSIDRREWSLFFQEERDSLISILYPVKGQDPPMGEVLIPDFRCFAEPKPKRVIPTLVIAGKASLYTSVEDCQAIARHYGGISLVYQSSSCMPFAEESKRFNKDVALFLKKTHNAPRAKPKKPEAEEPEASGGAKAKETP